MNQTFVGIERRLRRLNECLNRLEPLQNQSRSELAQDGYLRDIVERNLEVAAQCCIDIAGRILSLLQVERPPDAQGAIQKLGQLSILDTSLADRLAPVAGLRNILAHEYLELDWDIIYRCLKELDDFHRFKHEICEWLHRSEGEQKDDQPVG